jgi:hypothetical protein
MPSKAKRKIDTLEVEDPDGISWREEASAAWTAATDQAALQGGHPLDLYVPVPLPDFEAGKSSAVSREVLGRFVQDRESGIIHDVTVAVQSCEVDGIRQAMFFHFWEEVVADPTVEVPCPSCFP